MSKRREGETYEDYRQRRINDAKQLKERLKGTLAWDSLKQGTAVHSVKHPKYNHG